MPSTGTWIYSSRAIQQRSNTPAPARGIRTSRSSGIRHTCFEPTFRGGTDAAYVLRVRRRTVDACAAGRQLPAWVLRGSITPLIDTRTHLLARRGLPRLGVDWDGAVRLGAR